MAASDEPSHRTLPDAAQEMGAYASLCLYSDALLRAFFSFFFFFFCPHCIEHAIV